MTASSAASRNESGPPASDPLALTPLAPPAADVQPELSPAAAPSDATPGSAATGLVVADDPTPSRAASDRSGATLSLSAASPEVDPECTLSRTPVDSDNTGSLPPLNPQLVAPPIHSGASTPSTPALPLIAGYQVQREIGHGGMGRVYLALNLTLNRCDALKTLLTSLDGDARERFFQEARAAAALNHPNIVPVYECRADAATPYYTMLLVQSADGSPAASGKDLIRRFKREGAPTLSLVPLLRLAGVQVVPLPALLRPLAEISGAYFALVTHWIAEVAEALECAHQQGILHRDIKPSNLLLGADGRMMLADFGLAKSPQDPDFTARGEVMGTIRYLAPERVRGAAHDRRADVYALGLTLYEFLTFTSARSGASDPEVYRQILQEAPPSPRTLNAAVPETLERICLGAIAEDPAARYASAAEFANALSEWLSQSQHGSADARPASASSPAPAAADAFPGPRRSRAPWIAPALLLVGLISAGTVTGLWLTGRGADMRELATTAWRWVSGGTPAIAPQPIVAQDANVTPQKHEADPDKSEPPPREWQAGEPDPTAPPAVEVKPGQRPEAPVRPDPPRAATAAPQRAPVLALCLDEGDANDAELHVSSAATAKFDELLRARAERARDVASAGLLTTAATAPLAEIIRDAQSARTDYVLVVRVRTQATRTLHPGAIEGVKRDTHVRTRPGQVDAQDEVRIARDESAMRAWHTTIRIELLRTRDGQRVDGSVRSPGEDAVQQRGAAALDDAVRKLVAEQAPALFDAAVRDWRTAASPS